MKNKNEIFTFGLVKDYKWENRQDSLGKFIIEHKILYVCDVRIAPNMYPEWRCSGNRIEEMCIEFGIEYLHCPELGIPHKFRELPVGVEKLRNWYRRKQLTKRGAINRMYQLYQCLDMGNMVLIAADNSKKFITQFSHRIELRLYLEEYLENYENYIREKSEGESRAKS